MHLCVPTPVSPCTNSPSIKFPYTLSAIFGCFDTLVHVRYMTVTTNDLLFTFGIDGSARGMNAYGVLNA